MKENIIQKKTYDFALRIVKLYKYLKYEKKEYVLSRQLLRSGTSIGANIEEAIGGQSTNDFISKTSIAYKEARETVYWLKILKDSEFIPVKGAESLMNELNEIINIIASILKTTKQKNQKIILNS